MSPTSGDGSNQDEASLFRVEGKEETINIKLFMSVLWRARFIFTLTGTTCLLLALLLLQISPYWYTSTMVVAPATTDQSSLASLALGAIAGQFGSNIALQQPVFNEYQALLTSDPLAQELVKDPKVLPKIFYGAWDSDAKTWRSRDNVIGWLKDFARFMVGLPPWTPPNAEALAKYLNDNLGIDADTNTGFVTMTFQSKDPVFADYFLNELHRTANRLLLQDGRKRSQERMSYLLKTLPKVTVAEQRDVLINLLSQVQQQDMVTNADPQFASIIVAPAIVSSVPTWPNPVMIIVLAFIATVFITLVALMAVNATIGVDAANERIFAVGRWLRRPRFNFRRRRPAPVAPTYEDGRTTTAREKREPQHSA